MRYADSLGFFEKGKTVETYAAAAFYIALRSISVLILSYRLHICLSISAKK